MEGSPADLESLEIINGSSSMRQLREMVIKAADVGVTVVATGEPGTGKEMVARNIHRLSGTRRRNAFVRYSQDSLLGAEEIAQISGILFVRRAEKTEARNLGMLFDLSRDARKRNHAPQIVFSVEAAWKNI